MKTFVWVFAVSLFLRLWFNFIDVHTNTSYACDAAEYLRDAQGIEAALTKAFGYPQFFSAAVHVLSDCANSGEIVLIKETFGPLQEMSISGPAFPVFIFSCYKLFGQTPCFEGWTIPVAVQCLLSALTAVLIASIGNDCWGKKTGLIAGVLAALYPGFIVNSGRLYSETFACFLICSVLWLAIGYLLKRRTHYQWGLLIGICLFSLQTTRSIMSILSLAILAFFVVSSLLVVHKRIVIARYLLAMLAAFVICLLPWLAVQKLAFGKASLLVDRVGNYNLFMGNDVDTFGWLSVPYPDSTGMEKESHWQSLKQAIHRSPERWFKLMLDKPVRLLKLPWNDFKVSVGWITPAAQAILHQLILVFATTGLIFIFSYSGSEFQRPKILAKSLILFTFLIHLAYLLFITVPRYNLTAMPEVILFAGAGLALIIDAVQSRKSMPMTIRVLLAIVLLIFIAKLDLASIAVKFSAPAAVALTQFELLMIIILKALALFMFFFSCWELTKKVPFLHHRNYALISILFLALLTLPAYALPLRAHGRWYEWSQDLQRGGQCAYRLLNVTKQQAHQITHDGAYLAINLKDGSHLADDWDLYVNDVKLTGPFIPTMSMAQDLNLVHLNHDSTYTIEQESIVRILCNHSAINPLDLRQWYLIPISGKQGTNILNSANPVPFDGSGIRLAIKICKHADGPGTIYGAYDIDKRFSMVPSFFRFSWEKAFYGVENECGLSDPAYDQKISLRQASDNAYIKLLVPAADASNNINVLDRLHLIQSEYKEGMAKNSNLILSFKPKSNWLNPTDKNEYSLVRLFGEMTTSANDKTLVEAKMDFSTTSYSTPWVPGYLQSYGRHSPTKFDICFPIIINAFPASLKQIELRLSGDADKKCANLSQKELVRCSLEIYKTKRLPSGVCYEIF